MYARILVPLDGSAAGEAVLPLVERLCRGTSSMVVLVRIEEPDLGLSFEEESIQFAQEYLEEQAASLRRHHVHVSTSARSGSVVESLIRIVRDEDIGLIVMATHGRTASPALPFGGVAEQLLRSTPVPVLAMPSFAPGTRGQDPGTVPVPFQTLLVTTNGSEASRAIVPCASEFSRFFGSRVLVLRVLPRAQAEESMSRREAQQWLEEVAHEFERRGISTESILEIADDPVPVILDVVHRRKVDVIAMSTHGRSGLGGTAVGSITQAVLKQSPVPLLMVRAIRPRVRRSPKAVHRSP